MSTEIAILFSMLVSGNKEWDTIAELRKFDWRERFATLKGFASSRDASDRYSFWGAVGDPAEPEQIASFGELARLKFVEESDFEVALRIAVFLVEKGGLSGADFLRAQFDHIPPNIREVVVMALCALPPANIEEAMKEYIKSAIAEVRYWVAHAYGKSSRSDTVINGLLDLARDNVELVRREACVSLIRQHGCPVFNELIAAHRSNSEARTALRRLCETIGDQLEGKEGSSLDWLHEVYSELLSASESGPRRSH